MVLIPRSVRLEIASSGQLPDAPSKKLVEACVIVRKISEEESNGMKKGIMYMMLRK